MHIILIYKIIIIIIMMKIIIITVTCLAKEWQYLTSVPPWEKETYSALVLASSPAALASPYSRRNASTTCRAPGCGW